VVKYCHDNAGHFGAEKTVRLVTANYWFPKIHQYVKKYLKSCVQCLYQKERSEIEGEDDELSEEDEGLIEDDQLLQNGREEESFNVAGFDDGCWVDDNAI
jgi:Integrase zinc binding domain